VGRVGNVARHDEGSWQIGREVGGAARVDDDAPSASEQGARQREAQPASGAGD
jgi:hypothetical protein